MTRVGKNWDFNQMHGRFTLPPPSLFFNYALLLVLKIVFYVHMKHIGQDRET
jgi:hypothetical protein